MVATCTSTKSLAIYTTHIIITDTGAAIAAATGAASSTGATTSIGATAISATAAATGAATSIGAATRSAMDTVTATATNIATTTTQSIAIKATTTPMTATTEQEEDNASFEVFDEQDSSNSSNDASFEVFDEDESNGDDHFSITPKEVLEFMLKRAKKNPQAFIILLDLRFNELIFMLLRAESNADPKLYCTALKYAMLLTANTNATHYVEMMSNFVISRKCMSEAERLLHDKFTLFRKTKNKKTIYSDRFVEWTMRDIRQRLGKFFKESTTSQLTDVVLQMHKSKQYQNDHASAPAEANKESRTRSTIKLDNSFLEAYVWCEASNLWLGKPMSVPSKAYHRRKDDENLSKIPSPRHLYSTDNVEHPLSNGILSSISRGLQRSEAYFERFHLHGNPRETTRPKSNLKQVTINQEEVKESELEHAVCLDHKKLYKSKLYTVERIKKELEVLDSFLEMAELPTTNPSGQWYKNKKELVEALVNGRVQLKEKFASTWEEIAKKSVIQRLQGPNASQSAFEIIEKEIEENSFFFHFNGTQSLESYDEDYIYFPFKSGINNQDDEGKDRDFQMDDDIDNLTRNINLNPSHPFDITGFLG